MVVLRCVRLCTRIKNAFVDLDREILENVCLTLPSCVDYVD